MIAISTITQNTSGAVVLHGFLKTDRDNTGRVNRTATLDGGCVIDNQGFSDSDRTIAGSFEIDKTTGDLLWAIFEASPMVNLALDHGFYRAAFSSLKVDNGIADFSLLIQEALHE